MTVCAFNVGAMEYVALGDAALYKENLLQRNQLRQTVDTATYARLLRMCNNVAACQRIHAQIASCGHQQDALLGDLLAHTYVKCGNPFPAVQVLLKVANRDVVLWTRVVAAFTQQGHCKEALQLFQQIQLQGLTPDKVTFLTVLDACAKASALSQGKLIHACLVECGLESDSVVSNALVNMYGKCRSLEDAQNSFVKIRQRSLFSWTAMMGAYVQLGSCNEAIQLYKRMQLEGVVPDRVTFATLLSACAKLEALAEGKVVHACIQESGLESELVVGNAVIHMYSKCGSPRDAREMFDKMPQRDAVSWNTMIAAYAREGDNQLVFQLFEQMLLLGLKPNSITLLTILNSCSGSECLQRGILLHSLILESGLEADALLLTALLNMYSKCGSLEDVHWMFNQIHDRDVVACNVLITSYVEREYCKEALECFRQMQLEGLRPNKVIFIAVLNACDDAAFLADGEIIHRCAVECGLSADEVVGTCLVNMYSNCGKLEDAEKLFGEMGLHDMVSWTGMIAAYAKEHFLRALYLYRQMLLQGMMPDKVTFVTILSGCEVLADGKLIHACITEAGFDSDVSVGNAVVNMYCKCAELEIARTMFHGLPVQQRVTWNNLITAYTLHGSASEAIKLYERMQLEGVTPDKVTFITVLNACINLSALENGRNIHSHITESGFEADVSVANAILNMYGKCGDLDYAQAMFEKMGEQNTVTWNGMIAAYSQHGHGKQAVQLFPQMMQEGFQPDNVSFVSMLHACGHVGLVDEACHYYGSMAGDYGVRPTVENAGCIIDLLGRSGHLDDVEKFIERNSFQSNAVMWTSLLGACRVSGDVEKGRRAAENVFEIDPRNAEAYVVLSNIYYATKQNV